MSSLPPPQQVSVLLRSARFALLLAGILYGRSKQAIYEVQENEYREHQAELKVIRDKQMKILKAKIKKEEAETVKLLETGKLFDEPEDDDDDDE